MELESVENVVVNILSRHDCCCLSVPDLFVLCSRVYAEHLLPQLGLGSQHLPAELHGLEGFVDFLRSWNSSNVVLIGEGSNCMAQLCLPLSQGDEPESNTAACVPAGQTLRAGGFGPYDTPEASENSGGSSTHPLYDPDASESWGPGKHRPQTVQKPSTPDDRVTFIRQLLCRCVFDFVLKEANAHSYTSAVPLDDARQTCIQYLLAAMSEVPSEFMHEQNLEELLLWQSNKYMTALSQHRQKMVFMSPLASSLSNQLSSCQQVTSISSPNPMATPHSNPRGGPFHSPNNNPAWGGQGNPGHKTPTSRQSSLGPQPPLPPPHSSVPNAHPHNLPPYAVHPANATNLNGGTANLSGARCPGHNQGPLLGTMSLPPFLPPFPQGGVNGPHQQPPLSPEDFASGMAQGHPHAHGRGPHPPGAPGPMHAPPPHPARAAMLEAAVVALLRARRAFDGPKSQAVEAVRAQLATNPEFAAEPALASLPAFHGFLLCLPAVQVWTSKTSDIVRCMLRHTDEEPQGVAGLAPASNNFAVATHVDADIFQVMAQLPTLYKAVHVFLVSRRPPAVDAKAAVPLHSLLRCLRSPLCSAAQWATHPGLRSAPILLKFLKNDTALAVTAAESEKADYAALYVHRYHNSFRTAMKALDSNPTLPSCTSSVHSSPEASMPPHLTSRSRSGTRASSASDLTAAASAAEDLLAAAATAAPATPPHASVGFPNNLLGSSNASVLGMHAAWGFGPPNERPDKPDGTCVAIHGSLTAQSGPPVDTTGVTTHTSCSQSAFTPSSVLEPSVKILSDSNQIAQDVVSHPVRSPGSTEGAPVATVPSGYPSVGLFVKLWGPTADVNVLEEFLASQMNAHAWGFDWKASNVTCTSDTSTPTTHAQNACQPATTQKLSLLTLSTTTACIVWSVARGGVPECLARWLRDAGVWRCDMHADDLVNNFASDGVAAQGVVDLRELHSMVTPEATEKSNNLAIVTASVLGVRMPAMHAPPGHCDWSLWPLSPAHTNLTMQTAWLQAHSLERLGSRVAWDLTAMHACVVLSQQRMHVSTDGSIGNGGAINNTIGNGAAVTVMHDKGRASGGGSVGGLGGLAPSVAAAVHLSPAGPHLSSSGKADASAHVAEGCCGTHEAPVSIAAATGNPATESA